MAWPSHGIHTEVLRDGGGGDLCVRIWTGQDGNSYFEEGAIELAGGVRGDIMSGKTQRDQCLLPGNCIRRNICLARCACAAIRGNAGATDDQARLLRAACSVAAPSASAGRP